MLVQCNIVGAGVWSLFGACLWSVEWYVLGHALSSLGFQRLSHCILRGRRQLYVHRYAAANKMSSSNMHQTAWA